MLPDANIGIEEDEVLECDEPDNLGFPAEWDVDDFSYYADSWDES